MKIHRIAKRRIRRRDNVLDLAADLNIAVAANVAEGPSTTRVSTSRQSSAGEGKAPAEDRPATEGGADEQAGRGP